MLPPVPRPGLARPGLLAASALSLLVMLVIGAAPASATVFCVDAAGSMEANSIDASCETPKAAIQEALNAAAANAGEDTVLIGPGDYTLPAKANGNEVEYVSATPGNVVHVRGVGDPHLTMGATTATQAGLQVTAPAGSTVESLRLTVPANEDGGGDTALRLGGSAVGIAIAVDGPEATNATGVNLFNGTELRQSTVDLPIAAAPTNGAVAATSGDAAISDSFLRGHTGVSTSGNVFTVTRTTIDATYGNETDGGTIIYRDSLVELGTRSSAIGIALANYNAGSLALNAVVEGTTIVGGGANSTGIKVQADDGSETAMATIDSTVIEGPVAPIRVLADNGREAKAIIDYSNYDAGATVVNSDLTPGGESGQAVLDEIHTTEFEPGFVDAAAGDYHLVSTSALIDAGDPAAPEAGELDLDGGARAVSPLCPLASGRRDIGADEFAPTCAPPVEGGRGGSAGGGSEGGGTGGGSTASPPDTAIAGKRRVLTRTRRAKVVVRLSSATGTGFRCSVDRKPYRACGKRLVLRLKPGKHTIRAAAVTADGTLDPTPAKLVVRVVKRKPRHRA